ncbi:hypothetical protein Barb7_02901 [Bacteroidales bacterium Barb7]|nr:hypothetical protein Barb7_02901 [Bacteroidales bacterium Barb7]
MLVAVTVLLRSLRISLVSAIVPSWLSHGSSFRRLYILSKRSLLTLLSTKYLNIQYIAPVNVATVDTAIPIDSNKFIALFFRCSLHPSSCASLCFFRTFASELKASLHSRHLAIRRQI